MTTKLEINTPNHSATLLFILTVGMTASTVILAELNHTKKKVAHFLQQTSFPYKIKSEMQSLTPIIFKSRDQSSNDIHVDQTCSIGKDTVIVSIERKLVKRKLYIIGEYVTFVHVDNTSQHSSNSENCALKKYYTFINDRDFLKLINSMSDSEKKLLKEREYMGNFL